MNAVLVLGNSRPGKDQAFSSKCSRTFLGVQRGLKNQGTRILVCPEQSHPFILKSLRDNSYGRY